MPGLIDTHLHFYDFIVVRDPDSLEAFVQNQVPGRLDLFLKHGV